MNAKIWGAIAVALVLGACGAKQEEDTAPAADEAAAPAAEAPAATDPAVTDPMAADPDATATEPSAEETPPSQ